MYYLIILNILFIFMVFSLYQITSIIKENIEKEKDLKTTSMVIENIKLKGNEKDGEELLNILEKNHIKITFSL